ncbi:Nucleolar protein,Nop52 [Gracilaria domingensis]|nr:Nucleolar protein,Nop52 [Gracilaria domingensis]
MKSQHQIKFKRKRTNKKKVNSKAVEHLHETLDVVNNKVVVGERELKFARALSDTERRVREASLSSLQSWLRENGDKLQAREIDRLWKALFYCVWMADKPRVITSTIENVVGLSDIVGWPFLSGFFNCMMREWFGIDRHRVDKYYELTNAALSKCSDLVLGQNTDEAFRENLGKLDEVLQTQVWDQAYRQGQGFALHILDVYVDRVMYLFLKRGKTLPGNDVHKVFDNMLRGPMQIMQQPQKYSPAFIKRIMERILDRLIELVNAEEIGLKAKFRRDMIARASKLVMSFAANKSTPDSVRKDLYAMRERMRVEVFKFDESEKQKSKHVESGGTD